MERCKKCGSKNITIKNGYYCRTCGYETKEPKKQTIIDKIKQMTVEEMTKLLDKYAFCLAEGACPYLKDNNTGCVQCIGEWLQSEVEET